MKPLHLLTLLIFAGSACRKDSGSAPRNKPNNNKISATVTVLDRAPRNFIASGGDSTFFTHTIDTVRNDTIYYISGADAIGGISLYLFGVLQPGTYQFIEGTPGTNYNFLNYIESESIYPTLLVSTVGTDSLGNQLSSGTFNITRMTETEVEGTLNAEFRDTERLLVKIESMYFKGTFEYY